MPLRENRVGRRILSVVDFGKDPSRRARDPVASAPFFKMRQARSSAPRVVAYVYPFPRLPNPENSVRPTTGIGTRLRPRRIPKPLHRMKLICAWIRPFPRPKHVRAKINIPATRFHPPPMRPRKRPPARGMNTNGRGMPNAKASVKENRLGATGPHGHRVGMKDVIGMPLGASYNKMRFLLSESPAKGRLDTPVEYILIFCMENNQGTLNGRAVDPFG